MHAWWSELRSRALLPAIEAAPGTVEALHAVLGGPHLVPGTWGDFSAVSDPVGHRGKISPSRRGRGNTGTQYRDASCCLHAD